MTNRNYRDDFIRVSLNVRPRTESRRSESELHRLSIALQEADGGNLVSLYWYRQDLSFSCVEGTPRRHNRNTASR